MNAFIQHWVIHDLWDNMWSNIMAPSAITLAAVLITHIRSWRQKERHQEELKRHITGTLGAGDDR